MNNNSLGVMNNNPKRGGIDMPRGDRTGPNGMGQRTGRGMGYCNGYNSPGYANPSYGRGMGYGRGTGYGYGRGFGGRRFTFTEPNYQEPKYTAKDEINELKSEKDEIEKRIKQLEKQEE